MNWIPHVVPGTGTRDRDEGKEKHKHEDKMENEKSMSHAIAQPQWTWDWFLPSLWELELTSEFAYRFEFRMLQSCPASSKLRLYMRTLLQAIDLRVEPVYAWFQ